MAGTALSFCMHSVEPEDERRSLCNQWGSWHFVIPPALAQSNQDMCHHSTNSTDASAYSSNAKQMSDDDSLSHLRSFHGTLCESGHPCLLLTTAAVTKTAAAPNGSAGQPELLTRRARLRELTQSALLAAQGIGACRTHCRITGRTVRTA